MPAALIAALVLAGCGREAAPPASRDATAAAPVAPVDAAIPDAAAEVVADEREPPPPTIQWRFDIVPAKVKRSQRGKVMMSIVATNTGTAVFDPSRVRMEFTVDGERSMQLGMSFGHGGFDRTWSELKPGDTTKSSRRGLEHVVDLGTHEIVMSTDGVELARSTVTVTR